jgi:hypothetical protein
MNNEDFYGVIQEIREVVSNPENLKCTCPNDFCEWFGKCKECVVQHRYFGRHLPYCLQPIVKEKIKQLAETAEMHTEDKKRTTPEHWEYVRKMDKYNKA